MEQPVAKKILSFGKKTMIKVLLVEHNPRICDQLRSLLEFMGLEVCVATTGIEGILVYNRELPHLVILEQFLPLLSGEEVIYRLRTQVSPAELPVIVLTSSRFGRLDSSLEPCVNAICQKPLRIQQFRAAVTHTLQQVQNTIHPSPIPRYQAPEHFYLTWGELSQTPFSTLIFRLLQQQHTGILTLSLPQGERRFAFQSGELVYAESLIPGELFTDFVFKRLSKPMDRDRFEQAVAGAGGRAVLQRDAILRSGLLDEQEVDHLYNLYLENVLMGCYFLMQGPYQFLEDRAFVKRAAAYPINTLFLLFEAVCLYYRPHQLLQALSPYHLYRCHLTPLFEQQIAGVVRRIQNVSFSAQRFVGKTVQDLLQSLAPSSTFSAQILQTLSLARLIVFQGPDHTVGQPGLTLGREGPVVVEGALAPLGGLFEPPVTGSGHHHRLPPEPSSRFLPDDESTGDKAPHPTKGESSDFRKELSSLDTMNSVDGAELLRNVEQLTGISLRSPEQNKDHPSVIGLASAGEDLQPFRSQWDSVESMNFEFSAGEQSGTSPFTLEHEGEQSEEIPWLAFGSESLGADDVSWEADLPEEDPEVSEVSLLREPVAHGATHGQRDEVLDRQSPTLAVETPVPPTSWAASAQISEEVAAPFVADAVMVKPRESEAETRTLFHVGEVEWDARSSSAQDSNVENQQPWMPDVDSSSGLERSGQTHPTAFQRTENSRHPENSLELLERADTRVTSLPSDSFPTSSAIAKELDLPQTPTPSTSANTTLERYRRMETEHKQDRYSTLDDDFLRVQSRSLYVALDVSEDASQSEIEREYQNQHEHYTFPQGLNEMAPEQKAKVGEVLKRLSQAYQVLADSNSRQAYDLQLSERKSKTGNKFIYSLKQFRMGEAAFERGQLAEAEEFYHTAVEANPREPVYCVRLGWSIFQRHKPNPIKKLLACAYLERAIQMNPTSEDAYLCLGKIRKEEGAYAQAASLFQRILVLNPEHKEALMLLGDVSGFL